MGYKVFRTMAEVQAWAKQEFPGRSFSLEHIEGTRYVLVVKGKGKIQREVVYVKWEEKGQTDQTGDSVTRP